MTVYPISAEATNRWLSSQGARIGAIGCPSGVAAVKNAVPAGPSPPLAGPAPPAIIGGWASRSLIFSKDGPCDVHSGFHRPAVGCTAAGG